MTNEYLAQYKTKNYHVTQDNENDSYSLVNSHTNITEMKSPMLPQIVINMYNFEDALSELIKENPPKKIGTDNIIQFNPAVIDVDDVDDT